MLQLSLLFVSTLVTNQTKHNKLYSYRCLLFNEIINDKLYRRFALIYVCLAFK